MSVKIENYPENLWKTNLFKEYSHELFNKRVHIHDGSEINIQTAVEELGASLRKHELAELLGISFIHNHFQLNENEIVAGRLVKNDGVFPNALGSKNVLNLKVYNYLNEPNMIPYMWAYDKENQKFFALQYMDHSLDLVSRNLQALNDKAENLVAFIQEFKEIVQKYHLEDLLGVYLLYSGIFEENKALNEDNEYEVTDEVTRTQWIIPEKLEQIYESVRLCTDKQCSKQVVITGWTCAKKTRSNQHCV